MVHIHGSLSDDSALRYSSHYIHELPQEDEERLGKLFKTLDKDGNGKIDIHDLSVALKEFGVHHHYAEVKIVKTLFCEKHVSFLTYLYHCRNFCNSQTKVKLETCVLQSSFTMYANTKKTLNCNFRTWIKIKMVLIY